MKGLKILYLGDSHVGSTSLQRAKALRFLGHKVTMIQSFPENHTFFQRLNNWLYQKGVPLSEFHLSEINRRVQEYGRRGGFDLLWIDKGIYIKGSSIEDVIKNNLGIKIVGYSPDYMAARHNNSKWFIKHSKYYDLFITTKSYAVEWHEAIGCKRVLFQGNAFDPSTHKPYTLRPGEKGKIGGSIGFIGTFEEERFQSMGFLGKNGLGVKIYGSGWRKAPLSKGLTVMGFDILGSKYSRAICAFDINLCFLRKMNFDLQTQRSIEIPACGAFMLAERTSEHMALFKEGKEAEFFENNNELLDKCRFYLAHPQLRKKIAIAGRKKCFQEGYSYSNRLDQALKKLFSRNSLERRCING